MKRGLGLWIAIAMVGGVAAGYAANTYMEAGDLKTLAMVLGLITDGFLRLIKMIIAPLVFATLVAGIAHMENAAAIGRVGAKTMFWFISASIVSLTIGLIMVRLLQPGAGMHLAIPAHAAAAAGVDTSSFTIKDFVNHLIPRSIAEAMANNEILQIVVFSCFVGTAVASIDDRAPSTMAASSPTSLGPMKKTGV